MNRSTVHKFRLGWFLHCLSILSLLLNIFIGSTSLVYASQEQSPLYQSFDCTSATEIPQSECEALVALYNATDGSGWTDNTDWLQSGTPCSWYGVVCDQTGIIGLNLPGNNLSGSLPIEIFNLMNLQGIWFGNNQLTGGIPPELGNATNLRVLDLSSNQLMGSLPSEIGDLPELHILLLQNNRMGGEVPGSITNLGLTSMGLFCNSFSTSDPAVAAYLDGRNFRWGDECKVIASVETNTIETREFTHGGNLTLWVYDTQGGNLISGPVTLNSDGSGNSIFHPAGISLATGNLLVVKDELNVVIKELVLDAVDVSYIDYSNELAVGTAPAGSQIIINVRCLTGSCGKRTVTADGQGQWTANFGQPGTLPDEQTTTDLTPGYQAIQAFLVDKDRDATLGLYFQSSPFIMAIIDDPIVHGYQWYPDALVTVQVDDPGTSQSPDFIQTQQAQLTDGPAQTYLDFNLGNLTIQPGFTVTMTDSITEITHVVQPVEITMVDPELDIVSGVAVPLTSVNVAVVCSNRPCDGRRVTADSLGNWVADFSTAGPNPGEENAFDVLPGSQWQVFSWSGGGTTVFNFTHSTGELSQAVIQAGLKYNWVEGRQFTPNNSVEVTIFDSMNGTPLYGPQSWNTDGQGRIWLNDFDHNLNIQPGMFITMLDDATGTLESLVVQDLMITQVDFDAGLVYGTAPANTHVSVWLHDDGGFAETSSDSNGNWIADFGFPFSRYLWAGARVYDEDGDETFAEANRPNFAVSKDLHWVIARDWPLDSMITLTIEDPGSGVIYQNSQMAVPSDWNPDYSETFWNDLGDLQPGWMVTVSGGGFTKTHEITDLAVTDVNAELDQVSGTTSHGSNLWVSVYEPNGANRILDVAGNFNWLADFQTPGGTPETQGLFDLIPGTQGGAQDRDEDGDWTEEHWRVLNPTITVQPDHGWVDGYQWPIGDEVTITIDDDLDPENGIILQDTQTATPADWDPTQGWVTFNIEQEHRDVDLQPRQYISMSDGITSRSMMIEEVHFDSIDEDNDTAQGRGPADHPAGVWIRRNDAGHWLDITIGSDGHWFADFGADGFDIYNVQDANIQVFDDFGNSTMAHLPQPPPPPSFSADINNEFIEGYNWPLNAIVTLEIDDPSTGTSPDYSDSTVVKSVDWDPSQTWFNFELYPYDIKYGDIITLTDGTTTKQLVIANLTITNVDLDLDTVSGTTDPLTAVSISACGEGFCNFRDETSNQSGAWLANFSASGGGQDTLDLQYGQSISAFLWDPDGDSTTFSVQLNWIAPTSIPLVFAISSPVDLGIPIATVENISVLNTLNDSLFRIDQNSNLQPLAATEYTVSANGLVYTVTLRSNAVWSDGMPVTAQHFVDGILRVLDPNGGSDYAFPFFPIQNAQAFNAGEITDPALVGVRALDSQTLEFTLERPTAHFPLVMASAAVLPARLDIINQYGGNWTSPAHYVSNGLYRLVEYDSGHIVVEQNPLYDGPVTSSFSQIAFDVIPDPNQQIMEYKNGNVDVLLSTPLTDIMADPILRKDLTVMPSPGLQYIGFSSQVFPTNDPLVRKALAAAIDRQSIINDVLMTPWRVEATGVIPPELPGYQGSAAGYSYDPAQAQDFLTQAGFPGGTGFPDLNLIAVPSNAPVLEQVAAQWESVLGINVNIDYYSPGERFSILSSCRETPATCAYNGYMWGWAVDYPDAYNFLNDLFHPDGSYNFTQWDNAAYRNLLDLAVSELDPTQRILDLQLAQDILVGQDVAIAPLYHIDGALVIRPGIFPYYSPAYFSNLAYWSNVDPSNDGMYATVIGADGGMLSSDNDSVTVYVPAGALQSDTTLSITDLGGNYQITASQDQLNVITSYAIQPHGLQFDTPVTLTFGWNDSDNDGFVDGTSQYEANIWLRKDGENITPPCDQFAGCDMDANILTVQVSSLSHFELVAPVNQPPVNVSISAPIDPVNLAEFVNVTVTFEDPADFDNHQVTIGWGDTTITNSSIRGSTATMVHKYTSSGVYTIIATVTDSKGQSAQEIYQYVVVYDPDGGFVTGGGWIMSPEGAYTPNPSLTGKATFGFVSKYQKGAKVPTGNTEFQFKVADLNFKSTSYDWLVIAGTKAQYKGSGTINGLGEYKFMLTAIDGSPDKFRIKIWDSASDDVIYDNQLGAIDTAEPSTTIQGGSIVVHKSK